VHGHTPTDGCYHRTASFDCVMTLRDSGCPVGVALSKHSTCCVSEWEESQSGWAVDLQPVLFWIQLTRDMCV